MDLHTPGKKPDWHDVPNTERNSFQKIAASTYGLVTPGNVLTGAGYLITKSGFNDVDKGKTGRALLKVWAGRFFDVLDGFVANKTETKSVQGEAFDAIVDKKLMFDGLDLMGRKEIAPRPIVRSFGALSVANTLSAAQAKTKGIEMHSSKSGKVSTFIKWVSLLGYLSSRALGEMDFKKESKVVKKSSDALSIAAIGLGAYAAYGYFAKSFKDESTIEAQEQPDARYEACEGSSYILGDVEPSKQYPKD